VVATYATPQPDLPEFLSGSLAIFTPVGKKSRSKAGPGAGSNADLKRFRRALRSLDLVDSRLDVVSWGQQVQRYVGDKTVNEWFDLDNSDYANVYDFTYSSFERATHFSVGWRSWPLAAECEWMLPRLRDAVARSGHAEPFLVEIGAGAGAAAATISAAIKVPVIAVDSHPKTLGLAEQFASRTGGTVESRVGDMPGLADVLGDAIPAAVFGMGIYRHLQPHDHSRGSFSHWVEMQHILATHQVGPEVASFTKALGGVDLILAEIMCSDYLAEMASGLFPFGYEIPKGGITRIDGATPEGPTVAHGIHFTTADLPERDPNLLIEMFSPLPRPHGYFEADLESDGAAEALRLSVEPTEFIEAAEVEYADGSGRLRREVFAWGDHLAGQYVSTTRGFRNLKFFPQKDLRTVLERLHDDDAELRELGKACVYPCRLPAPAWEGPLDA
jgi:hypothetical protein